VCRPDREKADVLSSTPQTGIKEGPIMPLRTLADAISHYGRDAYLLTVAKDGPHTSHVTIELQVTTTPGG
jgi:hypothetical protein